MRLIEDWEKMWRAASVRVAAVWAALLAALAVNPNLLSGFVASLPEEVQALLPPWVRFLLTFTAVLGSVYAARVIKQPALKAE